MALKKRLTDEEKYGLSEEEIKLAEKYLRKHKTAGALKELEAAKLFELYLLGESLAKIAQQFTQYEMGQVCLTAALRKWPHDRDRMMHTLQDRVKAKVVKSVLEQVDFLTAMMSVANAEHLEKMVRYCTDPINNPKPDMRISNIKEYKDVAETLSKLVSSAGNGGGSKDKKPTMLDALTPRPKKGIEEPEEEDAATMLAEVVGDGKTD